MLDYYSTSQAASSTGVSVQTIRAYTRTYARWLSTEATPELGQARKFTAADLRLIRYAFTQTAAGKTREQVIEQLAAGALDHFDWQPPAEPIEPDTEAAEPLQDTSTALVPLESLKAAQALLQDARQREQAAAEQVVALQAQVNALQRELGEKAGELAGYKAAQYRSPRWWRAIFGGRAES